VDHLTAKISAPNEVLTDNVEALKGKRLLILGATGQIGRRLLNILARYNFPITDITLVSQNPTKVSYNLTPVQTEEIEKLNFNEYDFVFNCMPSEVITRYIGSLWDSKCVIIDKSSAFRMGPDIPLIIPEVNGHLIEGNRLIASPNCVVVPLVMTLHAIWKNLANIKHIAVSTYQSVSGAGNKAMSALLDETKRTFFEQKVIPQCFDKQIAFNIIPKIGRYDENFSTDEENKIEQETNKLLSSIVPNLSNLPMSVMSVRVPTLIGHSISLQIGCDCKSIPSVEADLVKYPGIQYVSEGAVTPTEAAYEDHVYISRLKRTSSGLALWITCDNLAKGGALNGFQIALLKARQG
jgi:aspartate-semialdehyde dehydrogenase